MTMNSRCRNTLLLHLDSQVHGVNNPASFNARVRHSLLQNVSLMPVKSAHVIVSPLGAQASLKYAELWSESSSKEIIINDDCVLFTEDRSTYSLQGRNREQSKLFQYEEDSLFRLPRTRIRATASYSHPHERGLQSSCFLTLRNNALLRHSNKNGMLLNEIYLGHVFSFNAMEVSVEENIIVILSSCFQKFGVRDKNIVQAVALLSISPFQVTHFFELRSSVVGREVTKVRYANGMIVLSAGSKSRVYSMTDLIRTGTTICTCGLGQDCDLLHGSAGVYPSAFPINFQVHEMPHLLLEVNSKPENMSFGCLPLNCLYTPSNQQKCYNLMRASDQHLLELDVGNRTIFDDCAFHPSIPNVLLHQSNHGLTAIKYIDDGSAPRLHEIFRVKTDGLQNPAELNRKRHSDRPFRSTAFQGAFLVHARTLYETHYDKSLDLIIVRATSSKAIMRSSLFIYTSRGQLIREVKLHHDVKRVISCSFALNLDKLSVIEHADGVFQLTVYQLKRAADIREHNLKKSNK